MLLREAQPSDLPFLREMLYEAVFWRASTNKPSFETGLAYPDVSKALAGWGARAGDLAVSATTGVAPFGAAWYRFWTDDHSLIGYIDATTPVLGIGVLRDHRQQGVGTRLIEWVIDYAARHAIPRISLSVSKDNYAIKLYRRQGFVEYADRGDAFTMVRHIT